jgi:integral membrane protein
MLQTPVGRLRLTGMAEGVSFLLLLGVAMPLKYLAHMHLPVRIVGLVHGLLFIALCVILLTVMLSERWPLRRGALVFAAAFIPFGPFIIDDWLLRQDSARELPKPGEPG